MDARRRRFLFRAVGGVALLLILAGSITDVAVTMFWDRNAMLTSVLADVLVLVVGVAVVNEWLDIRSAERWRTVAARRCPDRRPARCNGTRRVCDESAQEVRPGTAMPAS